MSVSVGRTRLKDETDTLVHAWRHVREVWNDSNRRQFEREFLEPLEHAVRTSLSAMDQMAEHLARARRECE